MMYLLIELDEGKCGKLQNRLREKRSQHLFLSVCLSVFIVLNLAKRALCTEKQRKKTN